jgi:D-aspartate ligase
MQSGSFPFQMTNKPPVLILDLYYGALQVARSLGRKGIPVYGIDKRPDPIAAHSRYITRLKAPEGDEELKDFMIDFSKNLGNKPVLFPMGDHHIIFLLKYGDILSRYYHYPMNPEVVLQLVSKIGSAKLLTKLNIPIAKTIVLKKGISSIPSMDGIDFPCVLKPNFHDLWQEDERAVDYIGLGQRVLLLENQSELAEAVEVLSPIDDMVLQEFIPGLTGNQYYYVGYRDRRHRILTSYVGNKIRTMPDCLGSETLLISVCNPDLLKCGDDILNRLDYIGPAGIDFKYDHCEEKYKVIEINCRLGINDAYLAKFGIDMPLIYYHDSLGLDVAPHNNYPDGVTWYDMFKDLEWMRMYHNKFHINWVTWVCQLLRGYSSHALFNSNDPRPFIKVFTDYLLRLIRKVYPIKLSTFRNKWYNKVLI